MQTSQTHQRHPQVRNQFWMTGRLPWIMRNLPKSPLSLQSLITLSPVQTHLLFLMSRLLCLCCVVTERLFLAMPPCCLRFVIVVFPDHTHLLFLILSSKLENVFNFSFFIVSQTNTVSVLYIIWDKG